MISSMSCVLIRKKHFFFLLLIIFFTFPLNTFAEESCCSSQGGAYYCEAATSKLYCKDGSVSSDCTCRLADTPTPSPSPIPTLVPTTIQPECPSFSSYDTASGVCKCQSGYAANNTECLPYHNYCWTKYGGNAIYDTEKNNCSCSQGYTWNNEQTKCISLNEFCHGKLGSKSYYDSDNSTCTCYQGYAIYNNQCQLIPTQMLSTPHNTSLVFIINTPVPNPTFATVKIPNATPTTYVVKDVSPTFAKKKNREVKKYISMRKIHKDGLDQILKNILDFIHRFLSGK
jgi:hypothetical protein